MNRKYLILSAAFSCLMAVSCQRENMGDQDNGSSRITYSPVVSSVPVTDTKGVLFNEDGLSGTFPTDWSFFVSAWDNAATPDNIIPGTAGTYQEVKMVGTQWNTVYEKDGTEYCREYIWKPGETKTFYAYAKLPSGASITNDASGQTLTDYTVPTSASDQTDILMGCYRGTGEGTGTAAIVFSHPFAAVRFKLGTLSGVTSFEVNSVSIEGVYAEGSARMTPTSAAAADAKDRFVWTPSGTATVSQTVSTQPTAGAPLFGEPFIIIPQTFSSTSTARIAFNVTVDGSNTFNIYHPLTSGSWDAGNEYVYTLDYNGHEGIQLWADGPYWATCNVGADKPEDYGWYFSWGHVEGYTYKVKSPDTTPAFYSVPGDIKLSGGFSTTNYTNPGFGITNPIPVNSTYDAAQKYQGTKWRIPTKAECEALIANTDMSYEKRNGVDGFRFAGRGDYAKRFIFIPASGFANGAIVDHATTAAFIRTATPGGTNQAYSLTLGYNSQGLSDAEQEDRNYKNVELDLLYGGRTIRAVENTAY